MAVEAYNEMNERYEFIQNQKKDLGEAKASLLATIQEIDDTAKEKFMLAFTSVREKNFIRVFRSLFNEEDFVRSDIDLIRSSRWNRILILR